jgi:hypothetical protein
VSFPSIRLVAYADRGDYVFVAVPNERGRWMRTDRAVVEVPCPACSSVCGEPCKGALVTYSVQTHFKRRRAWTEERRRRLAEARDVEARRQEYIDDLPSPALGTVPCDAAPPLDLDLIDRVLP